MIRRLLRGGFGILWKIVRAIAVLKWKIFKTFALYVLCFVIAEALTIRALHRDLEIRREDYFEKQISEVDVAYTAMTGTYGINAHTMYENVMELSGILNVLEEAQDASPERRAALRDWLYDQLLPLYKRALDQDAPLLNITLADGTVLLRMHHPDAFGDNMFESSPVNARVHDTGHEAFGFEAGRDFFVHRYVAPVFSHGRYLGNLELGVSLTGLKIQMERLLVRKFAFLLHRDVIAEYPQLAEQFVESDFSQEYVNRPEDSWMAEIVESFWQFIHSDEIAKEIEADLQDDLQDVDPHEVFRQRFAAKLDERRPFALSLLPGVVPTGPKDFIFSFLPIHDIQGRHVAYLAAYHHDSILSQYGKEFWLRVAGASLGWLALLAFIFFMRLTRRQIVRHKDQLQGITDNMNEGLCVLDHDQTITFVNPATERLLGYPRKELLKKPVDAVFRCWKHSGTAKEAISCSVCGFMDGSGFEQSAEYLVETKDGQLLHIDLIVSPLLDKKRKNTLGSILVFHDITARKQAEKELHEAKAFTESILTNVPEVIYSMDHQANLTYISPKCLDLIGYGVEELLHNKHLFMQGVHPEDRPRFKQNTRKALQSGHVISEEFRFIKKDGTTIWLRQSATPTMSANGDFLRLDASLYDVTAIKAAESALAEERNLLRTLIDHIPDVIYVKDTEGRYLTINQQFTNVFGLEADALERHAHDAIAQRVGAALQRQEQQVLETHTPILMQEEFCEPFDIWVSRTIVPLRNHRGDMFGILAIMRDITDRKQAEEKLIDANIELKEMVNNLTRTQNELVESAKMAALGQLIAGVAHEINTPLGAIQASISNITHALAHTTHQLPNVFQRLSLDDQQRFLAFIDEAVQPKHHLTSKEERRLRRALETALDDQGIQAADALADMLVDMGIYEYRADIDWALRHPDAELLVHTAYYLAIQQHGSENIALAVERASKVVFALKNYTHYDHTGDRAEAAIIDTLETVLTLYHNQLKHGIEVVRQYEAEPVIPCYPDELNQVWTNMVHNAIQAMAGTGTLTVGVSARPFENVPPAWRSDAGRWDEYVVVELTDSGPGIPDEVQARMFDPFFTTKPAGEGSGLGLDICRRIVEKHQGAITVDSEPGRTTFRVALPVIE